MMNANRNNRYTWLKALYLLPVVAVSLMASARTVTDYEMVPDNKPSVMALAKTDDSTLPAVKASAKDVKGVEEMIRQKDDDKPAVTLSQALVVIDGKESTYSALGKLSPSDIKSIDVLRANAATKYGEKGKNGVIEVKTKSGKGAAAVEEDEAVKAYDVVQVMPQFPGGSGAMMRYLADNVRYPEVAAKWGVQGRVVVSFIVRRDGSVANAKVVANLTKGESSANETVAKAEDKQEPAIDAEARQKGIEDGSAALADEALRVVKAMPAWTPGEDADGNKLNVKYNIPVSFKIK